jgi:curved DNA-binding protein CbpA
VAASHYETLGIAEGAAPEDVRRAYLDLARRLHPDRWSDAAPDERARAERRMQEVNEAWRVLGNAARRLAYDAGRRPTQTRVATASVPFPSGDLFVDEAPPDAVSRLIRALPWALVLLALGAIFVFTAYATGDPDGGTSCVQPDGSTAPSVPCETTGARVVELRVPDAGMCPPGTEAFQPAGDTNALCLRV